MARARNIKPGFFTNDELAQCEYGARLVFVGLWTCADREGRLEDRPLRIKAQLMPFETCAIDGWLDQLAQHGFITRYEIAGCKYIQVNNFKKHQNPHIKEPASTIPAPGAHQSSPADSLLLIPDSLLPIPPKPPRGRRVRLADRSYSPEFLRFWSVYPAYRKSGKPKAWEAWQAAILRSDPEAIIAAAADYGRSPLGCGQYSSLPATWLNQDRWDDDRGSWRLSAPGAAPAKREKSKQEQDDHLRYLIVRGGRKSGKSQEQIDAELVARGLQP